MDGNVDPVRVNDHDTVRSDGADGYVGSGYDQYAFSGEFAALDVNGDATVRLNDDRIDPADYPDNTLTVEGSGGWTSYSFTVDGNADPIRVNDHDSVRNNGADGYVGDGVDRYAFSGELAALDVNGDATVRLNGDRIDPTTYPENVLTIAGSGGWTNYDFTVGGIVTDTNIDRYLAR